MTRRADLPALPPGDDDPVALDEACRLFLRGLVTADTLRAAARRGDLIVERLGRQDAVTRAEINAWRKRCRSDRRAPASGSAQPATSPAAPPSGSSGTAEAQQAQDAALTIVEELTSRLRRTSAESTSPKQRSARVVPIKSSSRV